MGCIQVDTTSSTTREPDCTFTRGSGRRPFASTYSSELTEANLHMTQQSSVLNSALLTTYYAGQSGKHVHMNGARQNVGQPLHFSACARKNVSDPDINGVKTKLSPPLPPLRRLQRRIFQPENMPQDYLKLAVMFKYVYCTTF